ncbi:MAG: hypothetical protein H5T91_05025 [Synergistetes bacterium]|nr:hypothetical protein [Synergistota bacterium]MDK2870716.1 hypothetical protein [bacterium]
MKEVFYFPEEESPNKILAILVAILGIFSLILPIKVSLLVGAFMMNYPHMIIPYGSLALIITSVLLSTLTGVLQVFLFLSWNNAIRKNIENTKLLFQLSLETISNDKKESLKAFLSRLSELELATWAFWAYTVIYIISLISGIGFKIILNVIAFVFLAIYLQSLFSISSELSMLKNTAYSYFLERPALLPKVKERNIILVALFSVITFTLYWLYLMVKLTYELHDFIEEDKILRKHVITVLKRK